MNSITLVGIDLGKNTFHVHAQDRHGKMVLRKKFSRSQLLQWLSSLPACTVQWRLAAAPTTWRGS